MGGLIVECERCKKSMQRSSFNSKRRLCHDCLYKGVWTKTDNKYAAVANDELTKKQLVKKLDKMDKKMEKILDAQKLLDEGISETIQTKVDVAIEAALKDIGDKAALEHADDFIELKAGIEALQKEHEDKMKTLLASVNSRIIQLKIDVESKINLLTKRQRELRHHAKKRDWPLTQEGMTHSRFDLD